MGGLNQAQAHAQFVSNVVDHGMNIQMALEAPRFTKKTFGGCDVFRGEPHSRRRFARSSTARGHQLEVLGDFSSSWAAARRWFTTRLPG